MNDSETYMDVMFTEPYPRFPTRDGLTSVYSELMIVKGEPPFDEDDDHPVAAGPGEMPISAQTGPIKQELNKYNGNRPDCKIRLLYLVTFVLVAIVVGLSIYVSQIGQSKIISDRNYYDLNLTLQSKGAEFSALNTNLSVFKRMHNDLRDQFTEMETKFKSVNETKAQICELLNSRRDQACPQDWIRIEDRCFFISKLTIPYVEAKELCSHMDSKLLEINPKVEEKFVTKAAGDQDSVFWIGKCKAGEVASNLLYKVNAGKLDCGECNSSRISSCKDYLNRFICEKPAPLCPDIPETIWDLCQKPVGPT